MERYRKGSERNPHQSRSSQDGGGMEVDGGKQRFGRKKEGGEMEGNKADEWMDGARL